MISVSEALSIISKISYIPEQKIILLKDAHELILSEDIFSPIDMPPFRQSAMDGYALCMNSGNSYEIIEEIQAGTDKNPKLLPGQGARIFTGARVPDAADTIVIQEKVTRIENNITILDTISANQNIRPTSEQIQKGQVALTEGTKLTPAAIGFIAGLGIDKVAVYTPPKIAVITTGNELLKPGTKLTDGKVYESNSIQLDAALQQLQIKEITHYKVQDEYQSTKNIINQAIQNHDIVLISGGISVGDYDFVQQALSELGTEQLFYKIKQKPGKPLFFGKNKKTFIFALPGNPASSLTCFYIYVLPFVLKTMGARSNGLRRTTKLLTTTFTKKGDRAQFLKANVSDDAVTILEGQSSSMLYTYAIANALVYVPENKNTISPGEKVETILLP
ncbi:hypothetical protein GCM10022393_22930 [Aquimarina addita]|uniref:Molybdopterin molybdenumtransferase n=1 Tax=Aquimarina addita TaxID=870485 RepID=A0ABP6UM93_9FLAO